MMIGASMTSDSGMTTPPKAARLTVGAGRRAIAALTMGHSRPMRSQLAASGHQASKTTAEVTEVLATGSASRVVRSAGAMAALYPSHAPHRQSPDEVACGDGSLRPGACERALHRPRRDLPHSSNVHSQHVPPQCLASHGRDVAPAPPFTARIIGLAFFLPSGTAGE